MTAALFGRDRDAVRPHPRGRGIGPGRPPATKRAERRDDVGSSAGRVDIEEQAARMMVIGRASSADLAAVLEILDGAARWLHQQGIDQWPTGLPSLSPDRIAAQIQRGETYLISEDCAPIATIAVSAAGDPDYWPLGAPGHQQDQPAAGDVLPGTGMDLRAYGRRIPSQRRSAVPARRHPGSRGPRRTQPAVTGCLPIRRILLAPGSPAPRTAEGHPVPDDGRPHIM